MKLTENKRRILTTIAQQPRYAKHFTHKNHASLHPEAIQLYLNEMTEHGFLVEQDGLYTITTMGRQKLDIKAEVAQPRNIVASGTYHTGMGETSANYQRPGSDHSHIKSHGDRC